MELWTEDFDLLVEVVDARAAAAEAEARAAGQLSWNQWADAALELGAGPMHKHTAVQLPWQPTEAVRGGPPHSDT